VEGSNVSEEEVTSPDQHKPGPVRAARIGAVVTVLALLAMTLGDNAINTGLPWLIGIAAFIVLWLLFDWLLRKNGLRH
jgi:hypothetical protein